MSQQLSTSSRKSPWRNLVPNPKLPYTGSRHEEKNGGWNEMHSGNGAFSGSAWKHKKGNKLHNFLIIRPDCSHFSKSEVLLFGKQNVHYFWESQAAVCWHNSYQLRYNLSKTQLEEEMMKVTKMLNEKCSTGYIMNCVPVRSESSSSPSKMFTPKRVSKRKVMNIGNGYYDGDEINDDSESTGSIAYSKKRIVLSAKESVLKIGGNLDFSDDESDGDE